MELYRYNDPLDLEFSEVRLSKYNVIGETEKGYWINYGYPQYRKWVPKNGKNIFAWDTKLKAIKNYIARRESQIDIYKFRLDCAEANLRNAKKIKKDIEND